MRLSVTLLSTTLAILGLVTEALGSHHDVRHPVAAHLLKRQSTGRTTPLVKAFPGQADLPSQSELQSLNDSTGTVLPLQNIQGDILIGMKKQVERLIFLQINNGTAFKQSMQKYLSYITSTETLVSPPAQQPLAFVNVAFSQTGLTALGITDSLNDTQFASGMWADAVNLGDDTSKWLSPFTGTDIHVVVVIGSDQSSYLDEYQTSISSTFGSSITILTNLTGTVRPGDEAGHEHFGFLDGISQPAIEGFSTGALPGQAVVQNGVILTGRDGDNVTRPSWALDGTFMAFRYFQQYVPEFNQYLADNAVQNTADNLTTQESADFLGARMFGRWKSGAPLDLTPEIDDPTLGSDPQRNNNFNYSDTLTDQTRCPFAAHIRKTNPRADLPAGAADANHAIRASIPYGPEVTDAESTSNTTSEDRGLLFIEYQANIANGFRTQQITWANMANFPPNKPETPGVDAIIGQSSNRTTGGLDPNDQSKSFAVPQFVIPKGGEYFFVPSIPALMSDTFLG